VAAQTPAAGAEVEPGSKVTITVSTGVAANKPPKASMKAPGEAAVGKPVRLDGSSSRDDGTIARYLWEFGDGATAQGRMVAHAWAAPGTFEITLWVTDDKGEQDSITRTIVVR
jgi:chitodextrinase